MPPRERIDFTRPELEALTHVLSNTVDNDEFMAEDLPMERVPLAAARRASEKVYRAHRKMTTGHAADPDVFCNHCDNRGHTTIGLGGHRFGCAGCGYLLGEHPNAVGK